MSATKLTPPSFGAKIQPPEFYSLVFLFIDTMKATTSIRGIAAALNVAGIRTASGLEWSKSRLGNFIRTTKRSTETTN